MPKAASPAALPKVSGTASDSPVTSARPSVTVMILLPPVSAMLPFSADTVTEVASSSLTVTVALPAVLDAL